MSQQQQQSPLLSQLASFIIQQYSNTSPPFNDYYPLLVCRFLIYLYVLILLSNILMGYGKPNIKTRVYRKFQLVYGGEVMKIMEKEDMEDLEVTIKNTIQNATKEMKGTLVGYYHGGYNDSTQIVNNSNQCSQRRSLNVDETSQTSLGKRASRIKFNLLKNQYFDPPSVKKPHHQPQHQQTPITNSLMLANNDNQIIEGQSEEQILSPIPVFTRKLVAAEGRQQKDTYYPQQEELDSIGGIVSGQGKLSPSEENLLHLQDQIVVVTDTQDVPLGRLSPTANIMDNNQIQRIDNT